MKRALITGITGQDGAYLAQFLLSKGYEVHGLRRRSSVSNTSRIDHLRSEENVFGDGQHITLHYGDLTDAASMAHIISQIQPDEIYNLAAQSHVAVSFEVPVYTAQTNALGVVHLLEAIRLLGLAEKVRVYQASSSELFGKVQEIPQTEKTPFYPRSPYAVAKLYAYWMMINYREAYHMFASNGILFNHESPIRGETFVTRKVAKAVVRIAQGVQEKLHLGNLDARRDWGYAGDYVEAMWLILQHDEPDDFVIATGEQHTVREFAELAFACVGIPLVWQGNGLQECGINALTGAAVVAVDQRYFRPTEVESLCGDATKASKLLGWKPRMNFNGLVHHMIDEELRTYRNTALQGQFSARGVVREIQKGL